MAVVLWDAIFMLMIFSDRPLLMRYSNNIGEKSLFVNVYIMFVFGLLVVLEMSSLCNIELSYLCLKNTSQRVNCI